MIESISHITFVVKDIEKSSKLFEEVFSAEKIYTSGENYRSISMEIYLLINGLWIALMEGEKKMKTYHHVAFRVNHENFQKIKAKVVEMNLETLKDRHREAGEGESFYFYDYDNNLFELHCGDLRTRLNFYINNSD
jgi:catechol 2,3-dioxygenase-like lactoylglutathione lyase family enzyme